MINSLVNFWNSVENALHSVIEFMQKEINLQWAEKLLENLPSWVSDILIPEQTTVFGLLFGGGLTFVLLYTLIKWVLDIVL